MPTLEGYVVIGILVLAFALFVTERLRPEIVAFIVMVLLMLAGVVTPTEGVSGFSNPATLTVLALFILSAGVFKSGIVAAAAEKLAAVAGQSELRVLSLLILIVGPVAAFINNTAAVAIMIPLVLTLAKKSQTSPSKFLMPLSYIGMLAGTVTLIGTSTNILASEILLERTGRPFGMFEFAPVGLAVFAAGAVYLLTAGRLLLPARVPVPGAGGPQPREYQGELALREGSPFAGKRLEADLFRKKWRLEVVAVVRGGRTRYAPLEITLSVGDLVLLRGSKEDLAALSGPATRNAAAPAGAPGGAHIVEVIVAPDTSLVRQRFTAALVEREYDVTVVGLRRSRPAGWRARPLAATMLGFGDVLAVRASPRSIERLREDPNLVVGELAPVAGLNRVRSLAALAIVAGVVVAASLGALPIMVAALAGAVLMVLTGVLDADDLWKSVRWDVIFLLAGIIPLGIALERTGVADELGGAMAWAAGGLPPFAALLIFYGASLAMTSVISNNATVVLMVPIALSSARSLGVAPEPLVLAVMFAASAAFLTPIGYQTNLMVLGPGNYRFADFARVGAPLSVILALVTSVAIVAFFPFRPA
ncbi:MAG TPA: SLC13 family permease [Candidatus Thermoplasmatota archaeon]